MFSSNIKISNLCMLFVISVSGMYVLSGCATTADKDGSSLNIDALGGAVLEGQILKPPRGKKVQYYFDRKNAYYLEYLGLQNRPILTSISRKIKYRGVDADKVLTKMKSLRWNASGLHPLGDNCAVEFKCSYSWESGKIYIFSNAGEYYKTVALSKKFINDNGKLKNLIGKTAFVKVKNEELHHSVKNNEINKENEIIKLLGTDVELKSLYEKFKLERHKIMYADYLRNDGGFENMKKVFNLTKSVKDLDLIFLSRSENLREFVRIIDKTKNEFGEDQYSQAIAKYEVADDVKRERRLIQREIDEAALQEKLAIEIAERERKAELARQENEERKRIAEEKRKKAENERARKKAEREFRQLGRCKVGDVVKHREKWDTETSSGNVFADLLFDASAKEQFAITFYAVVEGYTGNKIKTIVNDYSVDQLRGGRWFQQKTNRKNEMHRYAEKYIGKVQFYKKSRCTN